jgi:hypothetical protein
LGKNTKTLSGEVQVVHFTDLHTGSVWGICPRGYKRSNGSRVELNRLQEESLDHWEDLWTRLEKANLPTVVLYGGEAIDNFHHDTPEVWTTDEQEMVEAAVQLHKPKVSQKFVVRKYGVLGTPAHSGKGGKYDDEFYARIETIPMGHGLTYGTQHLKIEISGVLFDVAHRGPAAGKGGLRGNAAMNYARSIYEERKPMGERIPAVVLRGHVHRKTDVTYTNQYSLERIRMIVSPGWQWKTEFAYGIDTVSDIADIGATVIRVKDGEVLSMKFDTWTAKQTREVIA